MTMRRTLERLEALTPARRADQVFPRWFNAALNVALVDKPEAVQGITDSPVWAEVTGPFPAFLTEKGVHDQIKARLGVVFPFIEGQCGQDRAKTFLAALTFADLLE